MLLVQNIVAYKSLKGKYRTTIAKNYSQFKNEIDKEIIIFGVIVLVKKWYIV